MFTIRSQSAIFRLMIALPNLCKRHFEDSKITLEIVSFLLRFGDATCSLDKDVFLGKSFYLVE